LLILYPLNAQKNNIKYGYTFLALLNFFKHVMKNLSLRLLTVGILALISAAACKKSKDGDSGGLSATINGSSYQGSQVTGIYQQGYITIGGVQFQGGDSLFLSLDIPDTAHVNNPIDLYSGGITYIKWKTKNTYEYDFNGSHGSTTLTSWDKANKKIAGNFKGVIYSVTNSNDSIVVANGQFNTTYK